MACQSGQRNAASKTGCKGDRATLREADQQHAMGRHAAFAFARDQGIDLDHRFGHAFMVGAVVEIHVADVVPGPHPRAAVDGHRAHRRMREHEADRRPVATHEFGDDGGEVIAIGTQAVQPQHAPLRLRASFVFNGVKQCGHG